MELERLGKYELLERLGRGGMGEVWKARDTQLRRFVAIKLLHADLQANPDFVKHFMREAQLVASLPAIPILCRSTISSLIRKDPASRRIW